MHVKIQAIANDETTLVTFRCARSERGDSMLIFALSSAPYNHVWRTGMPIILTSPCRAFLVYFTVSGSPVNKITEAARGVCTCFVSFKKASCVL